jgi:hypothetical protein
MQAAILAIRDTPMATQVQEGELLSIVQRQRARHRVQPRHAVIVEYQGMTSEDDCEAHPGRSIGLHW